MIKKIEEKKIQRRVLVMSLVGASLLTLHAVNKNGVIMTVDGEDVPTEEFLYLYEKNNLQQGEKQSLDDYLGLFETYRLKVAEGKSEGIDTTTAFLKEMEIYRKELLEPYITDTTFFNHLVDIVADREKTSVESSHIMIVRTNNPERDKRNLQLLDSLRTELLNGADFIELAKKYSQDKFSSDKGGYLGFTPAGTFPYGFETAVYETPEGGISEIVESHVGWHIVKSGARRPALDLKRPVKTYDEIKQEVKMKTSSPFDPRFHLLRKNVIENLKARHPEIPIDSLNEEEAYNVLIEAEEKSQYASNKDYRNLVDEYVNGSILYEVSVKNVWDKAANDLEGLQNYFNTHKGKYTWPSPHVKGILVEVVNDSVAEVMKLDAASMPADSIIPIIRKKYKNEAIAEKVNVAKGSNGMVDNLMFGGERVPTRFSNFETYFIINGRIVENPEELDDVKTSVINDYQVEVEEEWVNKLREKHKVEINNKELKALKKRLKQ